MLRSEATIGSQNRVKVELVQYTTLHMRRRYVLRVVTEPNAPNGASKMNDSESGVDLQSTKEKSYVVNAG